MSIWTENKPLFDALGGVGRTCDEIRHEAHAQTAGVVLEFKLKNWNGDTEQRMAVVETDRGFELYVRRKQGLTRLDQAAFRNPLAAQRWAEQQHACNGVFEV